MNKKEIMDYVTQTPENVNKNILSQKLDAFSGGSSVQYVPQTLTEAQKMQARANLDLYRLENEYLIKDAQVEFSGGEVELNTLPARVGTEYHIVINDQFGTGVCIKENVGTTMGDREVIYFHFEDENILCKLYPLRGGGSFIEYGVWEEDYTPFKGSATISIYGIVPKQISVEFLPSVVQYTEQILTQEEANQTRKNLGLPHYYLDYIDTKLLYRGMYHYGWSAEIDLLKTVETINNNCRIYCNGEVFIGKYCTEDITNIPLVGPDGHAFLGNAALLPYMPSEEALNYSIPNCPIAVCFEFVAGGEPDVQIYMEPETTYMALEISQCTNYRDQFYTTLGSEYLPKVSAVESATSEDIVEKFNQLLIAMQLAGYMNQ